VADQVDRRLIEREIEKPPSGGFLSIMQIQTSGEP
jgi:hypothetical protein